MLEFIESNYSNFILIESLEFFNIQLNFLFTFFEKHLNVWQAEFFNLDVMLFSDKMLFLKSIFSNGSINYLKWTKYHSYYSEFLSYICKNLRFFFLLKKLIFCQMLKKKFFFFLLILRIINYSIDRNQIAWLGCRISPDTNWYPLVAAKFFYRGEIRTHAQPRPQTLMVSWRLEHPSHHAVCLVVQLKCLK